MSAETALLACEGLLYRAKSLRRVLQAVELGELLIPVESELDSLEAAVKKLMDAFSPMDRERIVGTGVPVLGKGTKAQRRIRQRRFLDAYLLSGSISHAAKAAGMSRESHHFWVKSDPDYVRAFDAAKTKLEALPGPALDEGREG